MNPRDPNVYAVQEVADALGDLCEELILVGGCAVGLLITDTARPPSRATKDVDLVTEVTSLANYYELEEKLRTKGFQEHGDVICRWTRNRLIVDIMPAIDIGHGFTNRWYPLAVQNAQRITLPSGTEIRMVTAAYFIATKLESFRNRGGGNYEHHDIEDIVNIVDGRSELVDEVRAADESVVEFIKEEIDDLLADPRFTDQLPWQLYPDESNQSRVTLIIERMRKLAGL